MRVKQLKMQSFRGIGDLTLDFDEKEPTVLVGINGVGKSSILDCLAILLLPVVGRIQNSPETVRDFTNEDITNGYDETHNQITVSTVSSEFTWFLKWKPDETDEIYEQLMPLINEVKSNNKGVNQNAVIELYHKVIQNMKDGKIATNSTIGDQIERYYSLGDNLDSLFNNLNEKNTNILLVYYPVNRRVIDVNSEILNQPEFKEIDDYNQELTGGRNDFKIFFQWFRKQEDLENELRLENNPNHRDKKLEAVRQAISSLIPNFTNLRVRRSPLRMTLQKNGEELIINQLSDGEKCLLAMVGDLARRLAIANPGLEDPLQGFGVVLIDEIELHLHPKWQRMIIPALTRTFPNCQFIVTTHSPQVISEVKPEGIYILKKTDNGVIAVRPESSYGRDSNQILEDIMDVPKRPQEFQDSLHQLFQLIEKGNLDDARQLSQQIADIIGEDEPELVKARVSIKRKEILKR